MMDTLERWDGFNEQSWHERFEVLDQRFNELSHKYINAEIAHAAEITRLRAERNAGIAAATKALEDDAKLCDCFALEANECGCGSWDGYKSIKSERAVEIVRALAD